VDRKGFNGRGMPSQLIREVALARLGRWRSVTVRSLKKEHRPEFASGPPRGSSLVPGGGGGGGGGGARYVGIGEGPRCLFLNSGPPS